MTRAPILTVGPTPPPYNGMSVATELLAKVLEGRIPHVHLDTADRRGVSNIGKFELGNLWLAILHGARCLWLLATKRPEIVYVPIAQAWLPFLRDCLFLIPAKLTKRKVIIHLHGGYFATFYRQTSAIMRWIIRYALSGSSRAIVLGKSVECAFCGILPASRIRIVPNGIPDPPQELPSARTELHPPTLLFLSTLMAEKGVLDLLRGLPLIAQCVGSTHTILAGEWYSQADREAAARLLEALGPESTTEFVGPVGPERKAELFGRGDIFVFPTAYPFEGHPYVVLEAMAAGMPIVSTRWACIPEMVEDGVNGFLVEAGDVMAMAQRLCLLLSNPELRHRMGQHSRERFVTEFRFEIFAKRMRSIFAEVLGGSPQNVAAESI